MRILVVGATGVLGQEATKLLVAQGHRVHGMTRWEKRVPELKARGVEPVIGDLIDSRSLSRACSGIERVLVAAHGALGRGKYSSEAVDEVGHRNLIDAALAAKVLRFVYTSALGAAPDHPIDFFRTKWSTEQYLANSGLAHVIVRPSAFMEWHAHAFNGKGILEKGRTVILGSGTKRRNFVAARDVATIAVNALCEQSPLQRVVLIGGPGNFSNDEVAQLYARTAGIHPKIVHVPGSLLSVISALARPVHPGVARIMQMSSLSAERYPEEFDVEATAPKLPIRMTTLDEFVRARVEEARGITRH